MKYFVYILIVVFFNNCIAPKNKKIQKDILIPEVDKKFELFNIEFFEKETKSRKIKENEILIEENVQSYGYIRKIYYDSSFFKYNKKFYENKGIKEKGIIFNYGSQYGVWYYFDKKGNLIKEINTDEGYDFGWGDVIKFCRKNGAVLEKGYPKRGGLKTEIYKNEEEGNKVWTISYYNTKTDEYLEVTLDGKTGKEIKRRPLEFIGN